MKTLVAHPEPTWADWMLGSLEAGELLTRRAEIVHSASNAKKRLHQHQVHPFGLEHPRFESWHPTRDLRLQQGGTRESLAADQLVHLCLKWATLALLIVHAWDHLKQKPLTGRAS